MSAGRVWRRVRPVVLAAAVPVLLLAAGVRLADVVLAGSVLAVVVLGLHLWWARWLLAGERAARQAAERLVAEAELRELLAVDGRDEARAGQARLEAEIGRLVREVFAGDARRVPGDGGPAGRGQR